MIKLWSLHLYVFLYILKCDVTQSKNMKLYRVGRGLLWLHHFARCSNIQVSYLYELQSSNWLKNVFKKKKTDYRTFE